MFSTYKVIVIFILETTHRKKLLMEKYKKLTSVLKFYFHTFLKKYTVECWCSTANTYKYFSKFNSFNSVIESFNAYNY